MWGVELTGFSLLLMANQGTIGACALGGYVSLGLFVFIIVAGIYCTLNEKNPPGMVGKMFWLLGALEVQLILMGPDAELFKEEREREKKEDEEKGKVEAFETRTSRTSQETANKEKELEA